MTARKLMVIALLLVGVLLFTACEGDTETEESMYVDGMYSTSAEGYGGEIELNITIADDVIEEIEVVSHEETEGIGDEAINEIIDQAIGQQSTEGIDVVSGATVTSNAVIEAIEEAFELADAGGDAN
jgi:urocanate reductase